jgi:hypothetical protein
MHARRIGLSLVLATLLFAGPTVFAQDAQSAPPPAAAAKPIAVPAGKDKKDKKAEYTGPSTVVELPPAPMLDEEGKQRLDPEGKPMFNAPVRQQRDKKGHPLFDDKGKPVMQTAKDLGYDQHGKKLQQEKVKKVKETPLSIKRGILTVDGLTGKAALNYDIADLRFIYFYAPGIGITVVSNAPFTGAKEQPGAFNDKTLTVSASGHVLQLASDDHLLGKKPESAFVLVDRDFSLPSNFPVMGYGGIAKPPYAWPGAKANQKLSGVVEAPPLPSNLVPVQLLQPCPAGQMRSAARPAQPALVPPCQAITKAIPAPVVKN